MDRFFSKLDLRDIKIDPERTRFSPDDDFVADTDGDGAAHGAPQVAYDTTLPEVEQADNWIAEEPTPNSEVPTVVSNGHDRAASLDGGSDVLKVSSKSRPSAVAGAIAGSPGDWSCRGPGDWRRRNQPGDQGRGHRARLPPRDRHRCGLPAGVYRYHHRQRRSDGNPPGHRAALGIPPACPAPTPISTRTPPHQTASRRQQNSSNWRLRKIWRLSRSPTTTRSTRTCH